MMKHALVLASVITVILCVSENTLANLSGAGTELNPYLIQSRADFDEFANPANAATYWASGVYTKLMCNLDLSDTIYNQAPIAPYTGTVWNWEYEGTPFSGVFEGNNHTISKLKISAPNKNYIGLFGFLGTTGEIRNLGLNSVDVVGRESVGGLVAGNGGWISGSGYMNGGTITSCYVIGMVEGHEEVGGLCGENHGVINDCYSNVEVAGDEAVGGLSGENGGLIGQSYSTGTVTGSDEATGGLCGDNFGTITQSFSTSDVSGFNEVGGLCGENWGTISDCYAKGTVAGVYSVGGLCGENWGTIERSYATGKVEGDTVGGLCARGDGGSVFTVSFWDTETTDQENSYGGIDKTTAEMKDIQTFLDAGWDFDTVWVMPLQSYPRLVWEPYCGDDNHPYPLGDLNKDCRVNLIDLAMMAANWLKCTAPECD